jgi:hypothetical protein
LQIRVYYDRDSGDIVHVHKLVAAAAESLDDQRVDEEMSSFEESLRQRHPAEAGAAIDYLVVDEAALQEAVDPRVRLRVDVAARRLVPDDREGEVTEEVAILDAKVEAILRLVATIQDEDVWRTLRESWRRPGWTTPAERILVTGQLDSLRESLEQVRQQRGRLVHGCRAVGAKR